MARRVPKMSPEQLRRGIKKGYRSGLEEKVGEQLDIEQVDYGYETFRIPYMVPARAATYTIDFHLPNGIIVETKGQLTQSDRKKHLLIKEQEPDLDIRFVFSNPRNKIAKQSKTTYAAWCTKHGFPYAEKFIPVEWLREPVNQKSLERIKAIRK